MDTVSTTCGRGWVNRPNFKIPALSVLVIDPPATASGTDRVQVTPARKADPPGKVFLVTHLSSGKTFPVHLMPPQIAGFLHRHSRCTTDVRKQTEDLEHETASSWI